MNKNFSKLAVAGLISTVFNYQGVTGTEVELFSEVERHSYDRFDGFFSSFSPLNRELYRPFMNQLLGMDLQSSPGFIYSRDGKIFTRNEYGMEIPLGVQGGYKFMLDEFEGNLLGLINFFEIESGSHAFWSNYEMLKKDLGNRKLTDIYIQSELRAKFPGP
ncbi:MAG: hypothetical protein LBI26_00995 [Holosporales bacterium]|jgi:hypothetical protein|nr:hypothetical protein [Holosporales bacterium]